MNDKETQSTGFQLRRSRVVTVYVACFVGAALAPLESYFENGTVMVSELIISFLAFITGAAVATFAMWRFSRKGKFLHYELKNK
jgi:hypothetical protein